MARGNFLAPTGQEELQPPSGSAPLPPPLQNGARSLPPPEASRHLPAHIRAAVSLDGWEAGALLSTVHSVLFHSHTVGHSPWPHSTEEEARVRKGSGNQGGLVPNPNR